VSRLPRTDEQVLLAFSGYRGSIHARVLRSGPAGLALELDLPLSLRGGSADAKLEYVAEDGIQRLLGHARVESDPHVVTLDPRRNRPQLLQRAEVVEAPLAVDLVALRLNDPAAVAHRGRTTRLGGGNVGVAGVPGAYVGDLFQLDLDLPDGDRPARGQARVVRASPTGFEARWTRLNSTDRPRVVRLAYEARRAAGGRAA
jgi:hypothetical protein